MNNLVGVITSVASGGTSQFGRYLLIGGANTALSYGVYALGLIVGLPYQLANFFAMLVGIGVGFVAQGSIVFRTQLRGRLPFFVGMWLLLYYANITLIRGINLTGLDYYVAGLIAVIPITVLAYILQKKVVFAARIPGAHMLVISWMVAMLAIALVNVSVWQKFN